MKPLAVSPGDPAGVGPEITVQAIADAREEAFVVAGDARWFAARFAELGLATFAHAGERGYSAGDIGLVDCGRWQPATIASHAPSPEGGAAQLRALDAAIDCARAGEARAVVTGPTSKEAVVLGGTPFTGQTEHLAARCGLARDSVTMLFLGPRLRVGLVTTHLSVRRAVDAITPTRVRRATEHLIAALHGLGVPRPRVVITGLNPHAGEHGLFGDEETDAIAPASGPHDEAEISGPIGAETAFRRAASGAVDGVVTMLHDQATIASKLLDWQAAVNVTWGLPFVRGSVDHGVAYDAAEAGVADPEGMRAAIAMVGRLSTDPA